MKPKIQNGEDEANSMSLACMQPQFVVIPEKAQKLDKIQT
jgi:hypothetical protein